MFNGITGVTQKQGNAEAVPGGRKRYVFALLLDYIIAQLFNICQICKKSGMSKRISQGQSLAFAMSRRRRK
jgi:hypothetical protein